MVNHFGQSVDTLLENVFVTEQLKQLFGAKLLI